MGVEGRNGMVSLVDAGGDADGDVDADADGDADAHADGDADGDTDVEMGWDYRGEVSGWLNGNGG